MSQKGNKQSTNSRNTSASETARAAGKAMGGQRSAYTLSSDTSLKALVKKASASKAKK